LGHPVPGGYKYMDLAVKVGRVSNGTIKYGREFCGTSTQVSLLWQGPLVREGAPYQETQIVRQKTKIW
jgi:hypothetical protein